MTILGSSLCSSPIRPVLADECEAFGTLLAEQELPRGEGKVQVCGSDIGHVGMTVTSLKLVPGL